MDKFCRCHSYRLHSDVAANSGHTWRLVSSLLSRVPADERGDLIRQSYLQLRHFFENSAIPAMLEQYGLGKEPQMREILRWQYPDKARDGSASSLLTALLQVMFPPEAESSHIT